MAGLDDLIGAAGSLGGMSALAGPAAPIVGAVGLGLSVFGAIEKYQGAQKQTAAQIQEVKDEQQQDKVRQQAMEVQARRQQMEAFRNQQRARALALNNATSEGAQFGSGLQGGYGQISGQTNTNLLGISQNLQSGNQMFALNQDISNQKIAYAQAGGQINTGSGLSTLGGAMLSSMGTLKTLGVNSSTGGSGNVTNSWGGSTPDYGSKSW